MIARRLIVPAAIVVVVSWFIGIAAAYMAVVSDYDLDQVEVLM